MKKDGKNSIFVLLLAVLASYLLTIILLVVLSLLMLKFNMSGRVVSIYITAVYLIAPFTGALLLGKVMQQKRFLWGLLLALIYFFVYLGISLVFGDGDKDIGAYIKVAAVIIPGGMLGGMLS